ncbi:MAG: PD-(D/E)XK nuclease family protein [Candidatus Peribacteraceae bacterium]|nr:PD-(D/E)XK nuclease family protein [Candidatus Peribacteraceae bacterium]
MPLSYSQLQLYRRCPRQYEFAVVKHVKRPISPGESFGSSMHNTMKKWGGLELEESGQSPDTEQVQISLLPEEHHHGNAPRTRTLQTLRTLWRESLIGQGYATRAEADAALMRGDGILEETFRWWQQEPRNVIAVEKSFRLPLKGSTTPDIVITGRFDRVEKTDSGLRIIDFKTTDPRSEQDIENDLQLSIYALAAAEIWKEPVSELILLCMTEDGVTEQKTTRSTSQLKDAATMIRLLAERIATGDYTPTPSVGVCRSCPFRHLCDVRAI